MTDDAVRAYLEAQGWKPTPDGWVKDASTDVMYVYWVCELPYDNALRVASNTGVSFRGPLPSTPADLAALLRCLGAPGCERASWPYLGGVIAMVDAGLRREPNMVATFAAELAAALDRDGHVTAALELRRFLGYGAKEVPCHGHDAATPAISAESVGTERKATEGTCRSDSSAHSSPPIAPETGSGCAATETSRPSAHDTRQDGTTGEPTREQEAIDQTWNMGTCANELMDCLRTAKEIAITCTIPIDETVVEWSLVLDRASRYVNGWKLKHERRVADHPELIPCKLCGGAFDVEEMCCAKCEYEATTLTEWRILMGRRRTDWEGK
jgi:hypothetical protein